MLSSFALASKHAFVATRAAKHSLPVTSVAQLSTSAPDDGPVITAAPAPVLKNISINSLLLKKRKKQKISMVTAYDFPSAVHVDKAGIDILLVGDSVGMVELG
jgi:3-methyl-2-oxobutanoate hydroxymethyltransferase